MGAPFYLVACVAGKADRALPARELYRSDWFNKARAYVESQGARWAILSALHGAIDPATVIEPYEATMLDKTKHERGVWASIACDQLANITQRSNGYSPSWIDHEIVFLAGRLYRDPLNATPAFRGRWPNRTAPMEGLGIGEQKAWLARNTRQGPAQLELELPRAA